jgi:hypothetical protein
MQAIRRGVLGCALVTALMFGMSATAAEREPGLRDRAGSTITRIIKKLIIQILGDISIPPG